MKTRIQILTCFIAISICMGSAQAEKNGKNRFAGKGSSINEVPALPALLTRTVNDGKGAFLDVSLGGNVDEDDNDGSPSITLRLPPTTQGPFWPPSSLANENGDFIVVGALLQRDESGAVIPVANQAAIVSKNTVPPLDENGKEDFTNLFGAPYKVVRHLNLSEGSKDLEIELYTNSFGPFKGDFGGGPRIPAFGESDYNLNSFDINGNICPDLFPALSQRFTYMKASYPLHKAPIWGFQGDDLAFDIDSGKAYVPVEKNGKNCMPTGCEGEDNVHSRRSDPITLGEWLKADVRVKITLIDYDTSIEAYTAARFEVRAHNLLPGSLYQFVTVRTNVLAGFPLRKVPTLPALASLIVTDEKGKGHLSFRVENPFPAAEKDDAGLRIVGLAMGYKSDFSVWGLCPIRLGPGVGVHAPVNSFSDGTLDVTNFVTKAKVAH